MKNTAREMMEKWRKKIIKIIDDEEKRVITLLRVY